MRQKILVILLLIISPEGWSQSSIVAKDIEICTQLTLLDVSPNSLEAFKKNMSRLSKLAKQATLEEDYDWLLYESSEGQFLIVNFSYGLADVLTIDKYRQVFSKKGLKEEFDEIIDALGQLAIHVESNYMKEMLLPWSTVAQMSVAEFPLAQMIEFEININKLDAFDIEMRKLVKLLKATNYPYPLEGNRGALGGLGTMTLVWFYTEHDLFSGKESVENWMKEKKRFKELNQILTNLDNMTLSKKTYVLDYQRTMSY